MIVTCQHEWVELCQLRYRVDPPKGYHWEDAHYPEPECRNGIETVKLWYPDHIVHGALQTLNLQHPCMHGYRVHREREILTKEHPAYIDIYEEAYKFCQIYAGGKGCSKAGKIGGRVTKERGVGIFDPLIRSNHMQKLHKEVYVGEKRSSAQRKRAQTLGKEALSEIARKTNMGRMKSVVVTVEGKEFFFESIRSASRELNIKRDWIYKSIKTDTEVNGIIARLQDAT